ncbi:cob(I)yrinic acid a,c-diamide adenosyltransferase, partial [Nocardioides sp.]|uniref:cob(I)yrinic acid a,c-diamide adenosyltransferase n=1 Tax=Nocardioides sp. TaxID=35761 RepID=UPI0032196330
MPQGKPETVPDDGLTTAQRRSLPLLMVNTGDGKGKSTAAFGLAIRAWNQGWDVGVFQFVKSAKWRIGEQTVLERLGELHAQTGEGGPVEWHKMGSGWSWSR